MINLEGSWHFQTDRNDEGVAEKWFNKNLSNEIHLPPLGGILERRRIHFENKRYVYFMPMAKDAPYLNYLDNEVLQ